MTDEELKEFLEVFPNCPDPEHYPKAVAYLHKIFLYDKQIPKEEVKELPKEEVKELPKEEVKEKDVS